MDYDFQVGPPITEEEALTRVTELGLHAYAFDTELVDDEPLHWHEFDTFTWVISGTGRFMLEDGIVTEFSPGSSQALPAGCLHRVLAGPVYRVVVGTSMDPSEMTQPINKEPADRPAALAV